MTVSSTATATVTAIATTSTTTANATATINATATFCPKRPQEYVHLPATRSLAKNFVSSWMSASSVRVKLEKQPTKMFYGKDVGDSESFSNVGCCFGKNKLHICMLFKRKCGHFNIFIANKTHVKN